jgi:hypothetical protein
MHLTKFKPSLRSHPSTADTSLAVLFSYLSTENGEIEEPLMENIPPTIAGKKIIMLV